VETALWKDADKHKSRILFKIRCLANVIATPQSSLWTFVPTTFPVGGGKQSGIRQSVFDSLSPGEKQVPVKLYGEAQLERADGDWQLVSLRVDKSLPEAEWIELQKLTKELQ
jgi:hypothetical protein